MPQQYSYNQVQQPAMLQQPAGYPMALYNQSYQRPQSVQEQQPVQPQESQSSRIPGWVKTLGGTALGMAGVHAAQNVVAGLALKKSRALHNYLGRRLMTGLAGAPKGALHGGFLEGLATAAVPEFKIIGNELEHAGGKLRSALESSAQLKSLGFDLNKLTSDDYEVIRNALSGNFTGAVMNTDRGKALVDALSKSKLLNNFVGRGVGVGALVNADAAFKSNPILRNVGEGMASAISPENLARINAAKANGVTHDVASYAGEALGNGLLAMADPAAVAMNATKRFFASDLPNQMAAQGGYLMGMPKRIGDWVTRTSVTQPVREAFMRGLEGKDYSAAANVPGYKLLDAIGFNLPTQVIKQQVNNIGRALHAGGVNKDTLRAMDIYGTARDAVRNMYSPA